MSSKSSLNHLTDLPWVPQDLILAGTREIQAEGSSLAHNGYLEGIDQKTGTASIRWYCPRSISPTPLLIRGHVRYLKEGFETLSKTFGYDKLIAFVTRYKPHVTFDVHAYPRYPHTQGRVIYIAADIHPDKLCKEKLQNVSAGNIIAPPAVSVHPDDEDDPWFNYQGPYHHHQRYTPPITADLEVLLKPERTE